MAPFSFSSGSIWPNTRAQALGNGTIHLRKGEGQGTAWQYCSTQGMQQTITGKGNKRDGLFWLGLLPTNRGLKRLSYLPAVIRFKNLESGVRKGKIRYLPLVPLIPKRGTHCSQGPKAAQRFHHNVTQGGLSLIFPAPAQA